MYDNIIIHSLNPLVMTQKGEGYPDDRSFDIIYWQLQSPEKRWKAVYELQQTAFLIKGKGYEPRLDRSVAKFFPEQS